MGSAIALRDVVGKAQHRLMIAVVPPKSALNGYAFTLGAHGHRFTDEGGFGAVEIADEGGYAAIVAQFDLLGLDTAAVGENDGDATIQESQLAQAMLESGEVELGHGKGFRRGKKGDLGALAAFAIACLGKGGIGIAVREAHRVFAAVAENPELE